MYVNNLAMVALESEEGGIKPVISSRKTPIARP